MKQLYVQVREYLKSVCPNLVLIDIYNGQYLNPELAKNIPTPCVYMQNSITFDNENNGNCTIKLHLCQQSFADTQQGAFTAAGYDPLDVLDVIDAVYAAINGFDTTDFGVIQNVSITEVTTLNSLFVHVLEFNSLNGIPIDTSNAGEDIITEPEVNNEVEVTLDLVINKNNDLIS